MNNMNERGFTLLEMLFGFSIFLILMSFIPLSLKLVASHSMFEARVQSLEWKVFVNQLKKEVRMSERMLNRSNQLVLIKDGDTVSYERYRENIRRRVNMQGHEIVLQQVDTVQYEATPSGVKVIYKDLYNQEHQALLFMVMKDKAYDP
ncbi:prepilin-type N-terminal cleavage/methylation domain-containing protein [Bacillus sp. CRN 9]|nr:prepilin-type N-terminal cleavage/methylation domain-containing protein [Bacillus sp. CRN 9]